MRRGILKYFIAIDATAPPETLNIWAVNIDWLESPVQANICENILTKKLIIISYMQFR